MASGRRPDFPAHLGRTVSRGPAPCSKTPYFSVIAVPCRQGIVLLAMYRLIPILLAFLLWVPAALADRHAAGDGSLVVSDASARTITLKGNGLIFGHIQQGTLTILSYDAADTSAPQISGATAKIVGNGVVYSGSDIRFLLPNGRYTLRIDGTGIDISAVGKGTIVATGLGTDDDGTLSADGGPPQTIGVLPTTARFGVNSLATASNAGVPGLAKGQGSVTGVTPAKDRGR